MITILNYGMGNIRSVQNALDFLGEESRVTDKPEVLESADKLIIPGVGSFSKAMNNLNALGLIPVLNDLAHKKGIPILGICLGMQLFADIGDEDGPTQGLGWIPGHVKRIPSRGYEVKVPHVGFSRISSRNTPTGYLSEVLLNRDFYFVHSYHFDDCRQENILAICEYGQPIVAAVQSRNILGMQFHPEKSHSNGLLLLKSFVEN